MLGTVSPDGSPQASVVGVARDGGDLLVSTAAGRREVLNAARDPRVSLCAYDQDDPGQYVEVRGRAASAKTPGASSP